MASTTFGGILRSTGDNKKTSSAGSAQLAIKFRFAHDSSGAAVVKDASDSSAVVLPAGAIVVWGKGTSKSGHISVAQGNGMETSDFVGNQMTYHYGGAPARVFLPKGRM